MTPSQEKLLMDISRRLNVLERSDRFVFSKNIQLLDGRGFQFGKTVGTKIGTGIDQLISFYGVTPVNQPATVSDASGGSTVDSEARVAVNAVIDRLQELGLIA